MAHFIQCFPFARQWALHILLIYVYKYVSMMYVYVYIQTGVYDTLQMLFYLSLSQFVWLLNAHCYSWEH